MNQSYHSRQGFTLIEVAIVMVIIGLIVGGVVAAQNIVHAAKIHRTIKEIEQIRVGLASFQTKYAYLPGDLSNAASYWPSASGVTNGNGNGKIDVRAEVWQVWRQASLAGIMPYEHLTGEDSSVHAELAEIDVNVPASVFDEGGYTYYTYQSDVATWPPQTAEPAAITDGSYLVFGAQAIERITWNGLLTSSDAKAFDDKMDDGKGDTGRVLGNKGAHVPGTGDVCVVQATGLYDVSDQVFSVGDTPIDCALWIKMNL